MPRPARRSSRLRSSASGPPGEPLAMHRLTTTTGFEGATNTSHRSSAEEDVLKGSLILLSSSPRSRSFPDKDAGGGNSLPGRQWRGAERQVRSFELVIPHLRLVLPVREHAADHAMLDGSGSLVDRERTEIGDHAVHG